MTDFRSDPMETREGKGLARRAWDSYARTVNKASLPLLEPLVEKISAAVVTDLVGFWLTWHLEGGFEGFERMGMHRATIFRKVSRFRKVFGKHPDEFEFPGVRIDLEKYVAAKKAKRKK